MPVSPLRLVKNSMEFIPKSEIRRLPDQVRGLYVLYKHNRRTDSYNVVYVGMGPGREDGHSRQAFVTSAAQGPALDKDIE